MEKDDRIIVLGEDVHKLKGGTNGATKGLPEKYQGRILGTPISENAFAGLGGGMALDGRFRPVIEFLYLADILRRLQDVAQSHRVIPLVRLGLQMLP